MRMRWGLYLVSSWKLKELESKFFFGSIFIKELAFLGNLDNSSKMWGKELSLIILFLPYFLESS